MPSKRKPGVHFLIGELSVRFVDNQPFILHIKNLTKTPLPTNPIHPALFQIAARIETPASPRFTRSMPSVIQKVGAISEIYAKKSDSAERRKMARNAGLTPQKKIKQPNKITKETYEQRNWNSAIGRRVALIIYGFNASDSVNSDVSPHFHWATDQQDPMVVAGRQRSGDYRRSDDVSKLKQDLKGSTLVFGTKRIGLRPDASLADGAPEMKTLLPGWLAICKNDRLIGTLTDRDISILKT